MISATWCCGRAAWTSRCFGRAARAFETAAADLRVPRASRGQKNIAAFLELDLPGTKVVIGDGPDRPLLEKRHPSAAFLGFKFGVELAQALSSADVFAFPSCTDTFGLAMLEAIARGTPVAAYPVTGPIDVIASGVTGVLDEDLRKASLAALAVDREGCRRAAGEWTWQRATAA